jgi:UDP-glucose 4-epimerase
MRMTLTALVTGGSGFIGSHLVEDLLSKDWNVVVLDNFITGKKRFLESVENNDRCKIFEVDLLKESNLEKYFVGSQRVYHFAANADVRFGPSHPNKDLEQNTIVTQRVLEASRKSGVEEFIFSSTGSVYGEAKVIPTPEDAPFPIQTSFYGASKLAGEGLIEAYSEAFGFNSYIFRFVSILGPRYSHGHIYDFIAQLRNDPFNLKVLGNGYQKKSYLHVSDCISAINIAINESKLKTQIFNLGTEDFCEVRDSISWICDELGVKPNIQYGESARGWVGDNPLIFLNTQKIRQLGWKSRYTIEESVRTTANYLIGSTWIWE